MVQTIIGVCELCRGHVVVPEAWEGPGPPRAVCENCGARAVEQWPVVRMERPRKRDWRRGLDQARRFEKTSEERTRKMRALLMGVEEG